MSQPAEREEKIVYVQAERKPECWNPNPGAFWAIEERDWPMCNMRHASYSHGEHIGLTQADRAVCKMHDMLRDLLCVHAKELQRTQDFDLFMSRCESVWTVQLEISSESIAENRIAVVSHRYLRDIAGSLHMHAFHRQIVSQLRLGVTLDALLGLKTVPTYHSLLGFSLLLFKEMRSPRQMNLYIEQNDLLTSIYEANVDENIKGYCMATRPLRQLMMGFERLKGAMDEK